MGIVLLGYRGSGKTTIARLLAARLHWPVIDTDERIISNTGKTIREIFEEQGEPTFRDHETDVVRDAIAAENVIVSLGGGAILRSESRVLMMQSAHRRVFLRCDAAVLHDRIHADPLTAESRPSLTHLGGNIDEIEHLLATREPLYREVMTDELDVTHLAPAAAASKIASMIQ